MSTLDELIERNDPDPLLAEIDNRCSRRDWHGVSEIRTRCNAATERGKTLWGVAEHAAYRLALEAPGEHAALAIGADTGPLALGPLSEVAASSHEWHELAEHIEEGPLRGITAYECVALGEDLADDSSLQPQQRSFEMPLRLFDWEPEYAHAEYLEREARFPTPAIAALSSRPIVPSPNAEELDERQSIDNWRSLVTPWISQSNGTARVTSTAGPIDGAITRVSDGVDTVIELSTDDALRLMCWAASSGGGHGRRRGLAAGRSLTWQVLAETCGLLEDGEMPTGEELGEQIATLQWCTWGDTDLSKGWDLRLAVHDPVDEISFAIDAHDFDA